MICCVGVYKIQYTMTNLEPELCAICLEEMGGGGGASAETYTTACRHCFHRQCLERAYRMRPCCPYCRAELQINEFGAPSPRGIDDAFRDQLNNIIINDYDNIMNHVPNVDELLEQVVREMHQNNDINHILEEHYNREYNNIYFYAPQNNNRRRERNEYIAFPLAAVGADNNNTAAAA
jgi:hypothetical protein